MSFELDPRLRSVFESIFGPEFRVESKDDGPHNVPEWDSANHLQLILAIEDHFGVSFDTDEIVELTSIAKLQDRISLG